jgi:hypothetical protein
MSLNQATLQEEAFACQGYDGRNDSRTSEIKDLQVQ